jgi:hypothetical protein
MKKICLFVAALILALGVGLVGAKDYEMTKKTGDLTVVVKMDRNPPATGSNKMSIAIADASGKAVVDAAVSVEYGMPAMSGMGAMNYKAAGALKGDSYLAAIDFSMSGPWYVNIKINRDGKTQTVKLNVDVK